MLHGNAKSEAELRMALRHRVGLIVIDNLDEIDRLERLIGEGELGDDPQPVLVRATPDVSGDTHEKISTGQADSKFGFGMDRGRARRSSGSRAVAGLELRGVHAHVGSQLLELEPFRREVAQLAALSWPRPGFATWDLGGGLGVAYTAGQHPTGDRGLRRRRRRRPRASTWGSTRGS